MTISINSTVIKKYVSWIKKPQRDTYQQIKDASREDEKEDNDNRT